MLIPQHSSRALVDCEILEELIAQFSGYS